MAQLADPPTSTSTSALASWYDYLTAPAEGGPEQPTGEEFVLAAVLADETIVKIDDKARFYAGTRTYRSVGAKLELPEAARGADGVYTIDSGIYRVMTAIEYTATKRAEAARAEAVASAAVSSPRATRASSPARTPASLGVGIAQLSLSSASTGCGAHAKMVTLVAVGPRHIRRALERAAPVLEQARRANNETVTIVLGVADEREAEEALRVKGRSVLLAGAHELAHLAQGLTGPMRAYLRHALLLDCVAGSAAGMSANGGGGAWALPADAVPLDALPLALESRGVADLVEWKDALNRQWREWFARFERAQGAALDEDDAALLAAYTSFPTAAATKRHPPLPELPADATAVVGLRHAPPFGGVDHTIRWSIAKGAGGAYRAWPEPAARWASTGGGSASVYWSLVTWCGSTSAALRAAAPPPVLDLHTDEDELQAEVETTLVSLLTYAAPDGTQPFLARFDDLQGVVGPVVLGGRDDAQPMRCVWWALPDRAGGVLMLLPEAYVQMAMEGYAAQTPSTHGQSYLASQGFLALADADALPMQFSGVEPTEYDAELSAFGRRLWIPNGATEREASEAAVAVDSAPKAAAAVPTFRLQRDAELAQSGGALVPGARIPSAAARSTWFTSASSDEALSGLRVRWVRSATAPHLPTLDVDTYGGGAQLAYESF